jgi:tetratricopeptide (TPR) repeat protein
MGEREKALEYYEQALELNPGGVGILNDLARNLQEAGRLEDALTYALKSREQAPGIIKEWQWDSYGILSAVMPFLDKADEYFEIIKAATAKYGQDNPTFYIFLGKEQCMRGEFGEAITSYGRALEIKESHRALMGLGAAQWFSGDTDGALVSLRAARGPGNKQPYVYEGRLIALLKFVGRFEDIEQHLEMLRTEGKVDLWFWRAVDYCASMRRFDEAIALGNEMYESAEVTYKDDILWDMATWYRKKGDLGKALALLEEAKATLPTVYDSGYYGELAVIAAIRGQLDEAEEFARLAVQTSVGDWYRDEHLRLLARLQHADGRMDEAMSTLGSAEGNSVYWILHSGYLKAQLETVSQPPHPEDELRRVLYLATRLARDDRGRACAFARRYCALASARLGDRERAREEAAFALRLEPERADIAYVAACTYSLCGDTDQALDWLETAVEKGHQELWWARVDPDLDPLRGIPRFNEIMADWDRRLHALN